MLLRGRLAVACRARLAEVWGTRPIVTDGVADGLVVDRRAERGDVPGWALVTAMTVALVLVAWGIAEEQIGAIVRAAFGGMQGR